ncbi:MAG: DUF4270 domain-containing protein [Bacteroidales bacterium]|nr:DUF4270 domain-containing protein [Bacteroidales bacterium]
MRKGIIFSLLLCLLFCWSCYDELSQIGPGVQPDDDRISVFVDTVKFTASTEQTDYIYARSGYAQLGEFYDPTYGTLKSDYLCQFYAPPGYNFPTTVTNIDSVTFQILYQSWVGDSLALMHAAVYPVVNQLNTYFYTNTDPADYVNFSEGPWGEKTYSAYDRSISDSAHNSSSYYPTLSIKLPNEVGHTLLEGSQNGSFNDQDSFNNLFPGLYITTTGGTGSLITIDYSLLNVHFKYKVKRETTGEIDSVINGQATFNVTKEVIQLNQIKNQDLAYMLDPNETTTFLKTPAGVYTVVKLPIKEIMELHEDKNPHLNSVMFSMKAFPQLETGFNLKAPTKLLMTPKDSVLHFFEKQDIANGKTSFIASYDSTLLTYNFGNIAAFINNYKEEEYVDVALIPVSVETDSDGNMTSVTNYLKPGAAMLRKDKDYTDIVIVKTTF